MNNPSTQAVVRGKIQAKMAPKYSHVSGMWFVTCSIKPRKGSKMPTSISAQHELELMGIPPTGTEVEVSGELATTPWYGQLNTIRLVTTPDKIRREVTV